MSYVTRSQLQLGATTALSNGEFMLVDPHIDIPKNADITTSESATFFLYLALLWQTRAAPNLLEFTLFLKRALAVDSTILSHPLVLAWNDVCLRQTGIPLDDALLVSPSVVARLLVSKPPCQVYLPLSARMPLARPPL